MKVVQILLFVGFFEVTLKYFDFLKNVIFLFSVSILNTSRLGTVYTKQI